MIYLALTYQLLGAHYCLIREWAYKLKEKLNKTESLRFLSQPF